MQREQFQFWYRLPVVCRKEMLKYFTKSSGPTKCTGGIKSSLKYYVTRNCVLCWSTGHVVFFSIVKFKRSRWAEYVAGMEFTIRGDL